MPPPDAVRDRAVLVLDDILDAGELSAQIQALPEYQQAVAIFSQLAG